MIYGVRLIQVQYYALIKCKKMSKPKLNQLEPKICQRFFIAGFLSRCLWSLRDSYYIIFYHLRCLL